MRLKYEPASEPLHISVNPTSERLNCKHSTVFGTEEMRPVSHPDRELATHPGNFSLSLSRTHSLSLSLTLSLSHTYTHKLSLSLTHTLSRDGRDAAGLAPGLRARDPPG